MPYQLLDDPDITCGTWAPHCIKDVKNNSRMTKCANAGFTPVFGWFSLFFKERTGSKGQERTLDQGFSKLKEPVKKLTMNHQLFV